MEDFKHGDPVRVRSTGEAGIYAGTGPEDKETAILKSATGGLLSCPLSLLDRRTNVKTFTAPAPVRHSWQYCTVTLHFANREQAQQFFEAVKP